jgi:hypothetical protein
MDFFSMPDFSQMGQNIQDGLQSMGMGADTASSAYNALKWGGGLGLGLGALSALSGGNFRDGAMAGLLGGGLGGFLRGQNQNANKPLPGLLSTLAPNQGGSAFPMDEESAYINQNI